MLQIDKFVLLPYDRYERLLKGTNSNEEAPTRTEKKEEEINHDQLHHHIETEKDSRVVGEKTSESISQANSNTQNKRIPQQPPGIPQKPKQKKIRWYPLP